MLLIGFMLLCHCDNLNHLCFGDFSGKRNHTQVSHTLVHRLFAMNKSVLPAVTIMCRLPCINDSSEREISKS